MEHSPREILAMYGSDQAKILLNQLEKTPNIAYDYAARNYRFDLDLVANELRMYGFNIVPYPEHGKPYGLRLVGGKWAK